MREQDLAEFEATVNGGREDDGLAITREFGRELAKYARDYLATIEVNGKLAARVEELEAVLGDSADAGMAVRGLAAQAMRERDAAISRAEQAERALAEVAREKDDWVKALRADIGVWKGRAEQAERAFLECACAAGIYYAAEGHDDAPGPLAEVVKAIAAGVQAQHNVIDWELHQEELAALREVAEAARQMRGRDATIDAALNAPGGPDVEATHAAAGERVLTQHNIDRGLAKLDAMAVPR